MGDPNCPQCDEEARTGKTVNYVHHLCEMPTKPPEARCPHPARSGRHEWYTTKAPHVRAVCRACGARDPGPTPPVAVGMTDVLNEIADWPEGAIPDVPKPPISEGLEARAQVECAKWMRRDAPGKPLSEYVSEFAASELARVRERVEGLSKTYGDETEYLQRPDVLRLFDEEKP